MSCNIMVTSPDDCPPTCTASPLPLPETRLFCGLNSALAGNPGHGGQGAFAGRGSSIATTTNDATIPAANAPALATDGQQAGDGGIVITRTSVQVVTVASSTMSGGSVVTPPISSASSFLFPSPRIVETAEPTFTTSFPTSSTTSASSTTTPTMSEPTGTASALTATTGKKPFVKTTAGWVTILFIVMALLAAAIVGAWLWRRRKNMKVKKQGAIGGTGEVDEAALRRDTGDWETIPLNTVAGPEYRASVMPSANNGATGNRKPLTTTDRAGGESGQDVPARSSGERQRDAAAKMQSGAQGASSSRAQRSNAPPNADTAGFRTGRRAPPRERYSIASSMYSENSDHEDPKGALRNVPTSRGTGAFGSSSHPDDRRRQDEWWENATSGAPDAESAADRAANEAREKAVKVQADATGATQVVKDSWDYTKNICAGIPLPPKKPITGRGPRALPKPEDVARASGNDTPMGFQAPEQQDLEAEIHNIMETHQPTRIAGQDYDRNAPRGGTIRPMKSVNRGGGIVEVMEVTEEEMEQRRKWMAVEKEERRLANESGGKYKRVDGKLVGRTASPIADNEQIQEERVEWGIGGMQKVGNKKKVEGERVERRAVGRTAPPVASNEAIRKGEVRRKGAKL